MTLTVVHVVVGVGARRAAGRRVSHTAADPKWSQEEKISWTCQCQVSEVRLGTLVGWSPLEGNWSSIILENYDCDISGVEKYKYLSVIYLSIC